MWGTVLLLAIPAALDPVRLGIVVFLISRSRPMLNLFAFWLGSMTSFIAVAAGVLLLLRDFGLSVAQGLSSASASSTARYLQIASGLLALLIAVGLAVRQRARTRGGDRSARVRQPSAPTAFSRLLARAKDKLEAGSLWLAFIVGFGLPAAVWVALGAITASGAALGTQVSAVVVYGVLQLAIVEIPLVSYLATPVRTHEVILRLHDWVRAHGRQILAAILAVAGVLLVVNGA